MEWAGITAKRTNHTPYYFIPSSGVFILENTSIKQVSATAFLFWVFLYSISKNTVKSIFVHSVNEVISKKDHWLLQKNLEGKNTYSSLKSDLNSLYN